MHLDYNISALQRPQVYKENLWSLLPDDWFVEFDVFISAPLLPAHKIRKTLRNAF